MLMWGQPPAAVQSSEARRLSVKDGNLHIAAASIDLPLSPK
jgi:hypothetical protein